MKALILNSGIGKRMGSITAEKPKCLTDIPEGTILSRQLKIISDCGINDVIITTGPFEDKLISYCKNHFSLINFEFVNNGDYLKTNYIYSMYLAKSKLDDDIILMHGDLVFDKLIFKSILESETSCSVISTTSSIDNKDFKAELYDDATIKKISVDLKENCYSFQPLYKLLKNDMKLWADEIEKFCKNGDTACYAENALNGITDVCKIKTIDIKNGFCSEIDCTEDLIRVEKRIKNEKSLYVF